MKKIIFMIVSLLLFVFIVLLLIGNNNIKYIAILEKRILDNTNIIEIQYINYYDNYYIVCDNDTLYLFDSEYVKITSINLSLLFNNNKNYDIVYRKQTLMYMNSYVSDNSVIFKYYDIYTGEEIDEIIMG